MYISDNAGRAMVRNGFVYLLASLFCALFGAVYEYFSHEVYSYYMLYAFAFPLAGGALPFLTLALRGGRRPGRMSLQLYHAGIATLTVGSLMTGILEIYGTANRLTRLYWYAGFGLTAAAILRYCKKPKKKRPL